MKTAVDVYRLLPRTNCGRCGTGTCFGFAAKLASGMASPDACPAMTEEARAVLSAESKKRQGSPGTVYEQALKGLREKTRTADFEKIAKRFKARLIGRDCLEMPFLNEAYRVCKDSVLGRDGMEARPWISILIYNHILMPDPPPPSGEWITFSSVPASHAKDKAWAGHVEEVIARRFSGDLEGLCAACERMAGVKAEVEGGHDAAYEFRFFPIYPALLLFYDAVANEGFPAQCKLLLDRNVPHYLDIESIVVLGEEFAARLTG